MIVVYGIAEVLNPVKRQMSDALHASMMHVLGMPEEKRAHRFIPLAREDFFYPGGRTESYTVVEINLMEGRKVETKKRLIKDIFSRFQRELGIDPVDVEITIKEQPDHCWGFRGLTGDEAKLNYNLKV